jgi:hypothetical protein
MVQARPTARSLLRAKLRAYRALLGQADDSRDQMVIRALIQEIVERLAEMEC